MKKRLKAKLVVLLLGLFSLFTLAGCQLGVTVDQIMSGNNLTAQVTYYANGGKFDGGRNIKEMYYKEDSPIFNIGVTSTTLNGTATIEYSNHDLLGWYEVELNADGTPKFADEENRIPVLSDTKVDFSTKIQKGEHWYVGAKWQARVKLIVQLVCDEGVEIIDKLSNTSYKNGATLKTFSYDAGTNAVQAFPEMEDKQGGQVFVEYYNEPACITPVDFPVEQMDGQNSDRIVYAKYIDSSYTVIRNASQFENMWKNPTAGMKYYLARDIDMNRVALAPMDSFACELYGNGYTVSNVSVEKKGVNKDSVVSFFGDIAASAVMQDITFANAKAEYYLEANANPSTTDIHFVFNTLEDGATIENVVFSGEKSYLRIYKQMNQIYNENSISIDACLFGGYTNDAEYTAKYENGFKVEFSTENLVKYR